jgi:hypothetical protein
MEHWWKDVDKKYSTYLEKDLPQCYLTTNPLRTGLGSNSAPRCVNFKLKGVWKEASVEVVVPNLMYYDGTCQEE